MKGKKLNQPLDEAWTLVYSTEKAAAPKVVLCQTCQKSAPDCTCSQLGLLRGLKLVVQIEKKGRGGKVVTKISRLPPNERLLKELAAHLKKSAGCGGTFYREDGQGIVELQGERREQVVGLLAGLQG